MPAEDRTAAQILDLLRDTMADWMDGGRESPAASLAEIKDVTGLSDFMAYGVMHGLAEAGMAEQVPPAAWQLPNESTAEFLPLIEDQK